MRISKKKIIYFCLSLVLFIGLNYLLCFILMPSVGSSDKMWREYRKQEKLDMVITGTSLCYSCLNSEIIDPILNINSYNMATAAQELNNSYEAIETAIKDFNVKRVVLTFSYLNLVEYMNVRAETTFFRGKIANLPFGEKIKEIAKFSFSKRHFSAPESINHIFPWVYTHVKFRPKKIYNNVLEKLHVRNESYQKLYDETNAPSNSVLNYNKIGNENSKTTYVGVKFNYGKVSNESFEELKKISDLCKKNNIDLILVNPPKPAFDVLSYGDEYFELYDYIKAFAQSEQFDYYDFSLIKPVVFVNQDDYYKDFEHMNAKGQKAFSKSFAEFLKLRDKGLNEGVTIDDLFYTKDEYVSSIDYISCIYFDAETTAEQGIELTLHAYTGSDVTVLYEVLVKAPEDSEYKTIQEYSQTDTLIYSPEKHGNYLIRVNAKTPDSENAFDRYYEKKIYY